MVAEEPDLVPGDGLGPGVSQGSLHLAGLVGSYGFEAEAVGVMVGVKAVQATFSASTSVTVIATTWCAATASRCTYHRSPRRSRPDQCHSAGRAVVDPVLEAEATGHVARLIVLRSAGLVEQLLGEVDADDDMSRPGESDGRLGSVPAANVGHPQRRRALGEMNSQLAFDQALTHCVSRLAKTGDPGFDT